MVFITGACTHETTCVCVCVCTLLAFGPSCAWKHTEMVQMDVPTYLFQHASVAYRRISVPPETCGEISEIPRKKLRGKMPQIARNIADFVNNCGIIAEIAILVLVL